VRRLLREPVTLGLVALCVGWTLVAKQRGLTYSEAGALTGRQLWEGEYWRLFTATILHHLGTWIHLVTNGISLFFVGRVIERGCGRRILLVAVVGSALAGFAASLILDPDPMIVRMGISGAIAGLLGLLLAVEWALTRGVLDFLRQRNTLLILFFVLLSFPLAEYVFTGLKVDHFGHAGGFAFGLLFGLSYYTRKGVRPLRGAVVAFVLGILPVAYAAHPFFEPQYQIWRGRRAYGGGDFAAAARAFEFARELDPAALDNGGMREALLDTYLQLAAERLGGPDAGGFVAKARALGGRTPGPWMRFAEAAEARQCPDDAYAAWREAAALLPDSAAWAPLGRALRLLRARDHLPVLETIQVARGTAWGLRADLPLEARDAIEKELAETADALGRETVREEQKDDAALGLSELYWTLAENAGSDARRPGYRLRSADWLWRASKGPLVPDDVTARFRAAITEAALYGDPKAGEAAARWFRERGMPVPEPDLEGEEGGG